MIDYLIFNKKKDKKRSYLLKVIKFLIFRDFFGNFMNFVDFLFVYLYLK